MDLTACPSDGFRSLMTTPELRKAVCVQAVSMSLVVEVDVLKSTEGC
jgi:hypothetical protein